MNLDHRPDLVDRLAAAYALGTLRGGARRRLESIARASPAIRARVLLWQEHFAAMAELQPGQAPGANVWKRIANAIAADGGAARVQESTMFERLRRRLALWRGAALAAGLAAAVAFGVALQLSARPDIRYVAVLQDQAQKASVLVTFDPGKRTLTLQRVGGWREQPDRSLQLWALPPGQAPRSLGVLAGAPVVRLSASAGAVATAPALAISLEPKGGAPAGSGPTGPVLFQGALLQTML